MDIVVFADGTIYECSKFSFLPDLRVMYILIPGISWQDAVAIFTDAGKTKSIQYNGHKIEGYTNVDYIMPEADGMKARLSPAR